MRSLIKPADHLRKKRHRKLGDKNINLVQKKQTVEQRKKSKNN